VAGRRHRGLAVYTLAYEAPASNWLGTAMPLQDRAVNVLEILLGIPGLTDGPVIFIRHSLGGPIVKQILLDLDRQKGRRPEATGFLNRVTRVVFLANPHTGSRKGSLLWPTSRADGRTHRHPADVIVDEASADPGLTGLPPIPVDRSWS